MFQANPQLVDLIVDIAATAPKLAQYLGRNARVFDAVIGGDFFAPWPGTAALSRELCDLLNGMQGYETRLDGARHWMKEWHFRIGVHHLRGLIDGDEAGVQYASLADAVLAGVWETVVDEFSQKHGPTPGRGAAIVGMGSLGSQFLTAASDLDLIVIYDAEGIDTSQGQRPLATRLYYARLTQALVTALSAPMAQGRLYEVDMRLRPSGRQGPVATSLSAFKSYQINDAWTWEHLALTRARNVVGAQGVVAEIDAFRLGLLASPGDAAKIRENVQNMRARLAEEKPAMGPLDARHGPGRMMDIELFAQAVALVAGNPARAVRAQLKAGVQLGWVNNDACADLVAGHQLFQRVQGVRRLLTHDLLDLDAVGQGGRDLLLRETGMANPEALLTALAKAQVTAAAVIETALGRSQKLG